MLTSPNPIAPVQIALMVYKILLIEHRNDALHYQLKKSFHSLWYDIADITREPGNGLIDV
jgi:hypothetical protein